jgi:hypothetical protein
MSYTAYSCLLVASRDAVPAVLSDEDGIDERDQDVPLLYTGSRNAVLSLALGVLAGKLAPQALELFARPWRLDSQGNPRSTAGRQADALIASGLDAALAATDSLIGAWRSQPDIVADALAPVLRDFMGISEPATALRDVAASMPDTSLEEALEAFDSHHEEQDLHLSALFAWLQVFAAMLRTAQERDAAVVHIAWF